MAVKARRSEPGGGIPYGFHVIKLNETKPSEMAKFEEVKGSVQNHLFTEEAKKIVSSHINVMRKKPRSSYCINLKRTWRNYLIKEEFFILLKYLYE